MLNLENLINSPDIKEDKSSSFTKGVLNLSERSPREAFKIQSLGGKLSHKIRNGKKLAHEFTSESARAAALKRWGK